jgi:hypothetical protein
VNFLRQTADFIRSAPSPSLALALSLTLCSSRQRAEMLPEKRKHAQIVIKSCCSIKKFASRFLPRGWRRVGRGNEILIRPFAQIFSSEKASNNLPSPGPLSSSASQDNASPLFSRAQQNSFVEKSSALFQPKSDSGRLLSPGKYFGARLRRVWPRREIQGNCEK